MRQRFELESDLEFYCYLKAHLPHGWAIVARPQAGYFSEWNYHYVIYCHSEVYKEYKGSYKDLENGSFLNEAKQLLAVLGD